MAARPSDTVFTSEEMQYLEEDGIFFPQQPNSPVDKRQFSASLVSSISNTNTSPSSPSATVRLWNFQPSAISTDFPLGENSVAVLEYIGFETRTASEIFERFGTRPDPDHCSDGLLDYAIAHVSSLNYGNRDGDMDIKESLARVGLLPQIQFAITDPAFSDILWIRDVIILG